MITSSGNVAHCLNAGGMGRQDFETETMVAHPLLAKGNDSHDESKETYIAFDCKASGRAGFGVGEVAPTLRAMGHLNGNKAAGGQVAVAHTLKGEGFDASEDGTGRGTPIIPVAPFTLAIRGRGDSHQLEYRQDGTANAVLTPNGGRAGIGVGAIAHAIQAGALRENPASGPDGVGVQEGIAYTLEARQEVQAIQSAWAVRRLTPRECERLQGFPDDFTNVPWGKKDTSPDGPRYKALGNSFAVNVVRWIGQRIQKVEDICKELDRENME